MNPLLEDPLLPYLLLPYDPDEHEPKGGSSEKKGKGWCQITNKLRIENETYLSREIRRINYIENKLLPYFEISSPIQFEFGFGPKKIDPLITLDIPRMICTFQSRPVPKEKTSGDKGIDLALKCIYRIAGYNDEIFYKITRVFNQRIGIDLVKLIRASIDNENHMPLLDSQDAKLNLFTTRRKIYIAAQISGKILDFSAAERFCPVTFKIRALYNLSNDIAIHVVKFEKRENI